MAVLHTCHDYVLAPVYYWQARQVQRQMLRLPEPIGVRQGKVILDGQQSFGLMILGDSAAAGVGVDTQSQAIAGRVVDGLSERLADVRDLTWQLQASSGHTSFDLLTRLYAMPRTSIDVAVISIGVNDVLKGVALDDWYSNLMAIVAILRRKFEASSIIFIGVPPMQQMPSLPSPLNQLLGRQAARLDALMQQVCMDNQIIHLQLRDNLPSIDAAWFAKDGFHPSALTYEHLARVLVDRILAAQ